MVIELVLARVIFGFLELLLTGLDGGVVDFAFTN
jgi:hypothetical protein